MKRLFSVMSKKYQASFVLLFLFLVQGCTVLDNKIISKPSSKENQQPFDLDAVEGVDDLITQQKILEGLNGTQKKQACDYLSRQYRQHNLWQAGWLMAFDNAKQGNCLTQQDKLKVLKQLQTSAGLNENMKWLNQRQLDYYQQLNRQNNNNRSLNRKLKKSQQQHNQLKKRYDLLEQQIQELKAIETTINQRINSERSTAD